MAHRRRHRRECAGEGRAFDGRGAHLDLAAAVRSTESRDLRQPAGDHRGAPELALRTGGAFTRAARCDHRESNEDIRESRFFARDDRLTHRRGQARGDRGVRCRPLPEPAQRQRARRVADAREERRLRRQREGRRRQPDERSRPRGGRCAGSEPLAVRASRARTFRAISRGVAQSGRQRQRRVVQCEV